MSFLAKRCGVKFDPPSIVLVYEESDTKKMRQRIMPVRNFSKFSDCNKAAERLKNNERHRVYLEGVSRKQLERLHVVLRDRLRGRTLEESLAAMEPDPDEDLNKLGDDELARRKARMDELFERNRKRQGDPDFVYDLEVEFHTEDAKEPCSWDEDESDDEV
ncbi:centrosomal protein of 19 kDa [Scleropages formosus]|uniref:Centrosomal protein of 19 kDa n=1 Tax=Scleropages formosus TaxID=113540 RepID=A0A8C9RHJ7_SCLFO|nr:centrosomal protein of 19 kDa [Scleropages formosus]XP_018596634.2 centrosomal protein of 19 kDa [Scleropages formosus]